MNLHALRVFHTVARLASFSQAADALFISQPAVSKALKELEHQLDMQLIERAAKGKKLTLTASGNALYAHARSIFAIEKAAIDDINARKGLKKGALLIGTSTTIANYWLPPYLAKFKQKYPDIKIEVQVANTAQIEQALLDCTIDLALVEGSPHQTGIISRHWQQDKMSVVLSCDQQIGKNTQKWLNEQVWLLREPGSGTLEMSLKWLEKLKIQPQNVIQLGSNEAIAHAAAQGLGIALLPQVVCADLIALGKLQSLVEFEHMDMARPLLQLQFKDRPSSHAALAFEAVLYAE
ncbi:LysR family transcriptional regulator [Gayadomonas joobiniege]|uniref:LysR family transcriptional regulator n=1 Tax=Gayadomonas joobiniege TaxID=1234606 RepID=UPI000377CDB4|nr:LysR substrate-binding domain-containing protein [Gayadomonas joobiniege]